MVIYTHLYVLMTHTFTYSYIYTYSHRHIHTPTHRHTHTHTHTHTRYSHCLCIRTDPLNSSQNLGCCLHQYIYSENNGLSPPGSEMAALETFTVIIPALDGPLGFTLL